MQINKVQDANSNEHMPGRNQSHSRATGSLQVPVQVPGRVRATNSANAGALSTGEQMGVILMLVLGSAMQALANKAVEAVFVALLLLVAGMVVVKLVFSGRKPEMRVFLLMYVACVFVGGLAQIYSLAVFGNAQSATDARWIVLQISPQSPFRTLDTITRVDGPLAIVIWQQVYELTSWLGFKFGPYTGVMFNAAVMGLIGSIIVQIARDLFGDDPWRLRRVGTLVAANGLFILFGAVLLRDSFTTFFSTLMLLGIIRFLVQPKLRTLLFAAVLTGISVWSMGFLRPEAVPIFALYWLLAFLLIWLVRRSAMRFLIAIFALFAMLVATSYISVYLQDIQGIQAHQMEKYVGFVGTLASVTSENSLGARFVVNQPLPIRLVVGSVDLMISPIPLWAYFKIGLFDYHWIKGYNGFYQVFVLPLVFLGGLMTFRMFYSDRKQALPFVYLLMFLLINTVGVVATSLEQRHIGQFFAAMVILAALPDTRKVGTRNELKKISSFWFMGVLLIHLAWAALKLAL